MDNPVTGYLRLGLRIGRLVPGFVDAWFGDPALAAAVAAEPAPDPAELREQAELLLAEVSSGEGGVAEDVPREANLSDAGTASGEPVRAHSAAGDGARASSPETLAPDRREFLVAQLRALVCTTRRLTGEPVPFDEELEHYFEIRVRPTDPGRYAEAHDRIGWLLPGHGDLGKRLAAYRERDRSPVSRLDEAIRALSGALRERVRERYDLPEGESVTYSVVTDQPWNAFNHYLGGFRSHVEINADSGHGLSALPLLVTHEAYPGHHTDHCVKEEFLVRGRGQAEHTISLVNTPQCLIAEGAAEAALDAALGEGWGPWASDVLRGIGLYLDGELAELLLAETTQLLAARQDAAILLHERGGAPEDVVAYLRRWMLVDEDRARHMVRFLTDPLWRAYTSTYIEGARLVREWLGTGADRTTAYRRLLRTPLRPARLRAEIARHDPERKGRRAR